MPPANTPARTPSRPQTPAAQPARPLTPLSYLSSPGPDLAATLHASTTANDTDEANVAFLRNSLDNLDHPSPPTRRSHIDSARDPRSREYQSEHRASSSSFPTGRAETAEDLSRQERLRRVLSRLNRLHEPAASSSTTAAYTDRTPSPHRQSLYDWAPGWEEEEGELSAILNELRRQQPDTHPDILRVLSQSQLESNRQRDRDTAALSAAENDMADAVERLDRLERRNLARRERDRRARESEWLSLRSRAMLQRARQDGGAGSPSATERMLRYVMERERSGFSEEEERARSQGWFRPDSAGEERSEEQNGGGENGASGRGHWLLPPPAELRERDRQERVEAFRRGYLPENGAQRVPRVSTPPVQATPTSSSTSMLENALKYLSELRSCVGLEGALSAAIDNQLATKEFLADKHDDFVMDLDELPLLPYSSWLQPGAVFEGQQYASTASLTHQDRSSTSSRVEQINPNYRNSSSHHNSTAHPGFDHPPGSARIDASRPWRFHLPQPLKDSHDHWPVRVIIHAIDEDSMTLQGTMEAYDVPQHPSATHLSTTSSGSTTTNGERPKAGKKHAPITTYLEGHIIDLRTHTFLTPDTAPESQRKRSPFASPRSSAENIHFPSATPQTDAHNWLKLPPFSGLTSPASSSSTTTTQSPASDAARLLLSKRRLAALHKEYIFMRWKERCFVHSLHNDPCTAPATDRQGDQDRGHGLTISGFYYVSLRRCDGVVEGLYFDPSSTPFQHLRLKGAGSGWGAWGFR
ncbi:vacuolar import and degradation protein-domain-containing protein [Neohortaea acidophila]|uniref:Vacuolar import and degradation protein-domain-containing protein n=1 Tax=Neohortaea acidophila TaxID=245834 RepID=A0A6A6PVX9_9PEZI|nr:vacuolar import and degradation protein-domain-containing protein [Neohortaea acidophila]KAF2484192.1 vacuolar import and degradation protein-domain-containing protein [Neohortaea acidophila]